MIICPSGNTADDDQKEHQSKAIHQTPQSVSIRLAESRKILVSRPLRVNATPTRHLGHHGRHRLHQAVHILRHCTIHKTERCRHFGKQPCGRLLVERQVPMLRSCPITLVSDVYSKSQPDKRRTVQHNFLLISYLLQLHSSSVQPRTFRIGEIGA